MMRFPLPSLLFSLTLVALISPVGSEAGVSIPNSVVTHELLAPASPEILSFTATPPVIRKDEEVILRWRVSGAEHIWLSIAPTLDATRCIEQESGEMRVTTSLDTRWTLHAYGQGIHVFQEATVQVQVEGFCTIAGAVERDKVEYGTRVELYRLNSKTPTLTTPLDRAGRYSFSQVPVGDYRVLLRGNYPSSVRPSPFSNSIQCSPNGSHHANFRIASTEG